MTDKALISELTWRSLEMQREALSGMTAYDIDEMHMAFRPTTRKDTLHIHVISLGVIATNEKEFRVFLDIMKDRRAVLHSKEEFLGIAGKTLPVTALVKLWKVARRNGVGKIGARNSADKKKADSKSKIAIIAERWPLPSKEWPTKALLAEADISLNTAKAHLGKRPIAQYNYAAKMKRKERANAKR